MTTNSDDEIKRYLKQQSQELDSMLGEGLTDYLKLGFDSRFSGLMKLGYAIAIALSIVLFYCGYQFFTAPGADQGFWGVLLIVSFNAQVATKLWIFMQTNRNMLSKEMRMMEVRQRAWVEAKGLQ
ncbi:MAG: hypothetical protein CL595_09170 [Alteromonas sp.]|jgi:hypothetical protein|uniref:DUF6768 family protein n=1 Tax=Alteromonas australica TaxID=589873 RepID=UPI000C5DF3D6|nr:DUF6768 family protein [Alteromonas australica]MAO30417.1 hypothetical protein [Alteromonas sp.]|tara:strand:+ start:941 stop:1315 length:375 start_codon:yes stop_codon:yes gene_type:complete